MKFIKRSFKEFKSIFTSEDLLKENEEHANIVTASTMLNLFWICIITWVLVYLNIFKVGLKVMNMVAIRSILLLAVPAVICYIKKGRGKLTKHILFVCFAFMLAFADSVLKYNVTLIMVLPVILAARYYNKLKEMYLVEKNSYIVIKDKNKIVGYVYFINTTKNMYLNVINSNEIIDSFYGSDIKKYQKNDLLYINVNSIVLKREYNNKVIVKRIKKMINKYMNDKRKTYSNIEKSYIYIVNELEEKIAKELGYTKLKKISEECILYTK